MQGEAWDEGDECEECDEGAEQRRLHAPEELTCGGASTFPPLMALQVTPRAGEWLDVHEWYGWDVGGKTRERMHSSFVAGLAQRLVPHAFIAQERVAGGLGRRETAEHA